MNVRAFFRRLRARIKYRNHAAELRKELDVHRAMAEADLAGAVADARAARGRAARLLGNATLAREEARQVWVAPWRDHLRQDLRYALRTLWRDRGFTFTAGLTLAVGIGVLVGVFTVFHAVYLQPWPVREASRVFGISQTLVEPRPDDRSSKPADAGGPPVQ